MSLPVPPPDVLMSEIPYISILDALDLTTFISRIGSSSLSFFLNILSSISTELSILPSPSFPLEVSPSKAVYHARPSVNLLPHIFFPGEFIYNFAILLDELTLLES